MRRTILPREGYRDGFTRLQQWLLLHIMTQTRFDVWDLMLCEIEDAISDGFRVHYHLPYGHWITYFIFRVISGPDLDVVADFHRTSTEFPAYDFR